MKYKINWCENATTSTGKTYKKAELIGEDGSTTNVSVWSDYSMFGQVMPGQEVEGVINEKGKFKNLVDGNLGRRPQTIPAPFKAAMQQKQDNIHAAQENKENGVKTSSTIRMATDVVVAIGVQGMNDSEIQALITKWRRWFVASWDVDPKDTTPF